MKEVNIYYIYYIYYIELCCSFCFFRNLHSNHKIIAICDEETLKKENLTLDYTNNAFNKMHEKVLKLNETIEKEIIEIDKLYNSVNNEITKCYQKMHERII